MNKIRLLLASLLVALFTATNANAAVMQIKCIPELDYFSLTKIAEIDPDLIAESSLQGPNGAISYRPEFVKAMKDKYNIYVGMRGYSGKSYNENYKCDLPSGNLNVDMKIYTLWPQDPHGGGVTGADINLAYNGKLVYKGFVLNDGPAVDKIVESGGFVSFGGRDSYLKIKPYSAFYKELGVQNNEALASKEDSNYGFTSSAGKVSLPLTDKTVFAAPANFDLSKKPKDAVEYVGSSIFIETQKLLSDDKLDLKLAWPKLFPNEAASDYPDFEKVKHQNILDENAQGKLFFYYLKTQAKGK